MRIKLFTIITILSAAFPSLASEWLYSRWLSNPPAWKAATEASFSWVPPNCGYLRGENPSGKSIPFLTGIDLRASFSFNPATAVGHDYPGLYQGIGIAPAIFSAPSVIGTPISVYLFQGAPIARLPKGIWFGYEWQFGAAFGWKGSREQIVENEAPEGSKTTAHISLGFKFHIPLSENWEFETGIGVKHYSNGNTSFPNRGVNGLGITAGVSYAISNTRENPQPEPIENIISEWKPKWYFDLTAFGSWRKRVFLDKPEQIILPGKFGVAGLQFSPMRSLSRKFAVGAGLDMMWDESANLAPYRVEGTYGRDIKFTRPSFWKQLSIGTSLHAQLTMPIFTVDAGAGYDFIEADPKGRFYQTLTLRTFLTDRLYINTGYRLGRFRHQQNLMLGFGLRL